MTPKERYEGDKGVKEEEGRKREGVNGDKEEDKEEKEEKKDEISVTRRKRRKPVFLSLFSSP